MKHLRAVAVVVGLMGSLAASAQGDLARAITESAADLSNDAGAHLKAHLSPSGTVVEFYNSTLKHYFRTVEPAEVSAILAGAAGPGWARTNDDFPAWTAASKPPSAVEVCRFYAAGPNSHFYTINPAECAQVKLDPGWHYEGTAYYAAPAPGGLCTSEFTPVYRAYNNRFAFNDSNHRFTTVPATYQQMIADGWAGEGVVMCAPNFTTTAQQKTEQLLGGVWFTPKVTNGPLYPTRIAFTDLYQDPGSAEVYAYGETDREGVSLYSDRLTLAQYAVTLNQWLILAPFFSSGVYPAEVFVGLVSGNTFTGCYYFALSASNRGSCTNVTLTRQ